MHYSAAKVIVDHPDYYLFTDNCQNFARYLAERLCPGTLCPQTIQDVLSQLFNVSAPSSSLPGRYPESLMSCDSARVTAASEGLYWTPSENTYITARSQLSLNHSKQSMGPVSLSSDDRDRFVMSSGVYDPPTSQLERYLAPLNLIKSAFEPRWRSWRMFWGLPMELDSVLDLDQKIRQILLSELMQLQKDYIADMTLLLGCVIDSFHDNLRNAGESLPFRLQIWNYLDHKFLNVVRKILGHEFFSLLRPLKLRQAEEGPMIQMVGDIVEQWVFGRMELQENIESLCPAAEDLSLQSIRQDLDRHRAQFSLSSELVKVRLLNCIYLIK